MELHWARSVSNKLQERRNRLPLNAPEKKANSEVGPCRKLSKMATIGKRNTLMVLRKSKSGIYLDGGEYGKYSCPIAMCPRGL